jgi:hypothetical protein
VSKRFFACFILLLGIGVMNRELPECMGLRDDVSNDGEAAICNVQVLQGVSSRADTLDPQAASAFSKGSFPLPLLRRCSSHVLAPVARDGSALLRLIEQQRC